MVRSCAILVVLFFFSSCFSCCEREKTPALKVSGNHRFLVTENGDPFFWLGDTGWLLFTKLTREETERYLEDRRQKGFNVIQVMVLNSLDAVNVYGDTALVNSKVDQPRVTPGNSFDDPVQYDFWDHVDYVVRLAASKGIYMGLIPVWGSNVKAGLVTRDEAERYAAWIAGRYHQEKNVVWINGGDIKGSDSTAIWNTIGSTIRKNAGDQLITYHPFGRTQSSMWFHNEPWLDFNMFQSGHRRYDQDTSGLAYGEDNWRYASADYSLLPIKPTIDGEPSYEGIPQGLHDTTQPYWTDSDVRRYIYWSVFAGCCGFTYGHNSIMQFYRPSDKPAYGAKEYWYEAISAPGSFQVKYLKQLILSKPYFERIPAQDLLATEQGVKYDYIAITRGTGYVMAYTCNGSDIELAMGKLPWKGFSASWYNPRTGAKTTIGNFNNKGTETFDPPGEKESGNDWVLVLEES